MSGNHIAGSTKVTESMETIDEAIIAMLEDKHIADKSNGNNNANGVNHLNGDLENGVDFDQKEDVDAPFIPSTPKEEKKVTKAPSTPKGKQSPKKRSSTAITEATDGTISPPVPRKKRSPVKKKSTNTSFANGEGEGSDEKDTLPEPNSKARKRAQPNSVANARQIPKSWQEADEADRKLVTMKNEGKSWKEISQMWLDETGMVPAGSTLPNRYNRIRNNLTLLKEGEDVILLSTVNAIEARFISEKWSLVAKAMEEAGADKYSASFLQQQFKVVEEKAKNKADASPHEDVKATNGIYAPTANLPTKTKTEDETEDEADGAED